MSLALNIAAYTALALGAYLTVKSKVKTDNLNDLKDRVAILEKELKYAKDEHRENEKAISNLQGQLQTYKEIPLKAIASSLEKLSESNTNILTVLSNSAVIAAQDRDILTKSNQKVDTQVVEHQVVKEAK